MNYKYFSDYFYDREDLYFYKRYGNFLNHLSEVITHKITNDFLINTILVFLMLLHVVFIFLFFLIIGVNSPEWFTSFVFVLIVLVMLYFDEKYKMKSKSFYDLITRSYKKEIDIYLFILEDLKFEYLSIIDSYKVFKRYKYKFDIGLSKTGNIKDYISKIVEKFEVEESVFEILNNLHRIHYNTRYDNIYSESAKIDPFFKQISNYCKDKIHCRKF